MVTRIIKIPFGKGGLGKTEGSKDGPDAIINEIDETFLSEELKDFEYIIEEVEVDESDFSITHESITKAAEKGNAIFLGGDHSISYSTFKGFAKNNKGTGIIVFDAHPDLMDPTYIASHEDYLKKLINDGIVSPENVIIIGLRNIFQDELSFIREKGIRFYTSKMIYNNGIDNVCDEIMAKARSWSSIYVSVDIDVLDPAHAPGTNHLEPGGLSTRELLHIISRLKFIGKIKAADVVEVDPNKDLNAITCRVAARIVKELLPIE